MLINQLHSVNAVCPTNAADLGRVISIVARLF